MKKMLIALALATAVLPVTGAHAEGGGLKPSTAPLVQADENYSGSIRHEGNYNRSYSVDFWRLPLLRRDVVTMTWANAGRGAVSTCLTQGVDDFNWTEHDRRCTSSSDFGITAGGQARVQWTANDTTPASFIRFYGHSETSAKDAVYDFTVESVQHAVGVSLPSVVIPRSGTVRAKATLTNGQPVPDGTRFSLTVAWPGGRSVFVAPSRSGALAFAVRLPASAKGKRANMIVRRAADQNYLAASSVGRATRIG